MLFRRRLTFCRDKAKGNSLTTKVQAENPNPDPKTILHPKRKVLNKKQARILTANAGHSPVKLF
jgi:hypothetical protein